MTERKGRHEAVRNGHLAKHTITIGIGAVEFEQPRVLDGQSKAEAESSKILPTT